MHVVGQKIPGGELDTIPPPEPALVTVSVRLATAANVAVTLLAASIVTMHPAVPLQAPPQPEKVLVASAVAVSVTTLPWAKIALQTLPQVIPAGALVTVPVPFPEVRTSRVWVTAAKVALTDLAAVMVTTQPALPLQSPPQLTKLAPAAGVAVSVTTVPWSYDAVQLRPQLIPPDELVTVPGPVVLTVRR